MTGPQHYEAGEEALAEADKPSDHGWRVFYVQLAQAHFMAANVAATALSASQVPGNGWPDMRDDISRWHAVAGRN